MLVWAMLAISLWLLFAALCAWAERLDPRGDFLTGLAIALARIYLAIVHRARYEGLEHIPSGIDPGRLVVAANHASGVDPILIQCACPFYIRWMMLRDMMLPGLEIIWEWLDVIAVSPTDSQSARAALRHLKDDGVLGIFPEGAIERPPQRLMPFQPGTGVIVQRSGARVLLAAISGAPASTSAFASLFIPSRSRIRFLGVIDYTGSDWTPDRITADLQARLADALGWPAAAGKP